MHEIFGLIIIAGAVLALFGPKTLQSLAHNAGKGASKAKKIKDDVMTDLSMDDIAKLKKQLANVPLSPQQAVQKLLITEDKVPGAVGEKASVADQSPTIGPVPEIKNSEAGQEPH